MVSPFARLLPLLLVSALPPTATAATIEPPTSRAPEISAAEQQKMAALQQRNMLENSVKPFYEINNKFLDAVQPAGPNAKVLMDLINNTPNAQNASITAYFQFVLPVIVAYPGYTVLLCLGILLLLVIPVVGACWCSCRCCCNRCGATAKPMDGKFARCRRGVFGVLLGVLSTLVLGGAVLSFISNDLLHQNFLVDSSDNPVTIVNSSLGEIADNLDSMLKNFNNQTLLILNRQVPVVKKAVKNSSDSARDQIVRKTNIMELISTGQKITMMKAPFMDAANSLNVDKESFIEAYENMTKGVKSIANNLSMVFENCSIESCNASKTLLRSLTFIEADNIDLNISDRAIQVMSAFNSTQINEQLQKANYSLQNISEKMTAMGASKVDELIANLNDSRKIESYFRQLQTMVGNFTGHMRSVAGQLNNGTVMKKKWPQFLVEMDEYRMYGFIGLASTILLIVFFFYLGLCFGACGEPPYEDARFCNRGAGATLMSCGLGFSFLFFPFVVLIVICFFMTGAPVRTEMCRFLLKEHPSTSAFDSALSQVLTDLNITLSPDLPFPPNFTYHLLGDCENNTSIVTTLSLEKKISGSIIYEREVQPSVSALRNKMKKLNLQIDMHLIKNQTQELIDRFVNQGLNDAAPFMNVIRQLNQPAINKFNALNESLTAAGKATNSSVLVAESLARMNILKNEFDKQRDNLKANLMKLSKMGKISADVGNFRRLIEQFLSLTKMGSSLLMNQIDIAFNALERTMRDILVRAVDKVLSEHASCRVMHTQATRLVTLVCNNLLDPFNGYWLGIGWSLLILIPSMILACKLNYLYRKTENYVKDYEETDYLTYQGFYPSDVIPLERKSRGKNKQAKAPARQGLRGANGGILRHTGPLDPLPSCPAGPGMPDRRGWQHPYTKLPVYPRDAYD